MNLRKLTSLLSHFDLRIISRPSEIVNKDLIWNYQKSQDSSFRESSFRISTFFWKRHTRKSKISSPCHVLRVNLWKFLKSIGLKLEIAQAKNALELSMICCFEPLYAVVGFYCLRVARQSMIAIASELLFKGMCS